MCDVETLTQRRCLEVCFAEGVDGLRILVAQVDGTPLAYVNRCPHFSLPLNARPDEFLLTGDWKIMCAYHCALFRLADGFCIEGPAKGRSLERVPVAVSGGLIRIADE
ncbi:MAG: Rieske 2Fe-2S domain-containing protein [Pseudomonadota bacterium]